MSSQVLSNNATSLSVSTPKDIDYGALVKMLAMRKQDEHGRQVFSSKRGKQSLFASACAWVKSMRSLPREATLPSDVEASLRTEIKDFFAKRIEECFAEYDSYTVQTGGLRSKVSKLGKCSAEAFANAKFSRATRSDDETALSHLLTIGSLQRRIDSQLDKDTPDNEVIMVAQKKIDALRQARKELGKE